MDKTIKTTCGVAITNLMILALAGCSSSPAPWTQVDDSPWGAKHAAEEKAILADAELATPLSDPVLLAEPESVTTAVIIEEPVQMVEPEPEPEVIAPVVVEELSAEQEIMALAGTAYAVQVYASKTPESVERFKSNKNLTELKTVKTDRSGSIVYVLVDTFSDRSSAQKAAAELESKTGSKPWVRSVAGLQKIVAQ